MRTGDITTLGVTTTDTITNTGDITITSTGAGINLNTHSDAGDDVAVNTSQLVIKGDTGKVGIGTASPDEKLHSYIASGVITTRTESASLASGQESKFVARGSSRDAEIGSVYYDQSASGGSDAAIGYMYMQQGDGDSTYYWTDNSGNLRVSATNTHRGSTNGTVVGDQTSDIRLKKDIKSLPYGLSEILQLEPVEFKYKSGGGDRLGFSAQQVENIIPEVVYDTNDFVATEDGQDVELQKEGKDNDGKVTKEAVTKKGELSRRAMRYAEIVPVLVKAMQEQQAQIESLKSRIEKLENKNK